MNKTLYSMVAALASLGYVSAEDNNKTELKTEKLDDMVVVATGSERKSDELPYTVYKLSDDEMKLRLQKRSLMESIDDMAGVSTQKTASGMQSPFLRGFTGNQVVMMVDGVKMNNSTFRTGPNEYWNLINPFFFDDVEVLMGPSSVLYGSDAVGGTIYVKSGELEQGEKDAGFQWLGGEVYLRGATAERSHSEYLESNFAYGDKLTLKMGISNQDFGKLTTGDSTENPYTDYGTNSFNIRGTYFIDSKQSIDFGIDHEIMDDADRVHKTIYADDWKGINPGSDQRRVYDETRSMAFAKYKIRKGTGFIHEMDLGVSYQAYDREYLRVRSNDQYDRQQTEVGTFGANLRLQTLSDFGTWDYGVEFLVDDVDSWHRRYNPDGSINRIYDQGPVADDSKYYTSAFYIQNSYKFNPQWEWINGARYTYIKMDAGKVNLDNDDADGNVQSMEDSWDDISLSTRLIYHAIPRRLSFYGGISQAFRAPNLADVTSTGDFGGGDLAPAADVDPEEFTSFELGMNYTPDWGRLSLSTYYTKKKDIIGRPQAPYPGTQNIGDGDVVGFELTADYYINHEWTLFGNFMYVHGEEDNYIDRNSDNPLGEYYTSKMPPLSAQVGLRFQPSDRFWAECYVDMASNQDHLSLSDEADNRIPDGGTPGYATLNLRGGYRINDTTDLTVGVENLFDKEYRIHGSGVNEPGLNFVVGLRKTF